MITIEIIDRAIVHSFRNLSIDEKRNRNSFMFHNLLMNIIFRYYKNEATFENIYLRQQDLSKSINMYFDAISISRVKLIKILNNWCHDVQKSLIDRNIECFNHMMMNGLLISIIYEDDENDNNWDKNYSITYNFFINVITYLRMEEEATNFLAFFEKEFQ